MEDPADNIRRRRRELQEVGFGARDAAVAVGPEAEEQEFTDRFKEQYTARQAGLDAARQEDAAAQAREDDFTNRFKSQYTARQARLDAQRLADAAAAAGPPLTMDGAMADRKGLMADMIPPGDMRIPGLEPQEYDSEDTSLQLPPRDPSPGDDAARPAQPPRPALRRPEFRPPNVAQDLQSGRVEQNRRSAAASRAMPPVAQLARDRQVQRERNAAPGGLGVSPARVAGDRKDAAAAAAAPAPAKSGEDELRERQDRARESKEIDQYQRDKLKYDADLQVWRTQIDAAFEAGDNVRAAELAKQEPQPPEPPQSVTGGLDPNEVKAEWDHDNNPATPRIAETAEQTLQRLAQTDPAAYRRLQAAAQAAVGNDPEALGEWVSSQFGELEPGERLARMQESGQRLNANDTSAPNFAMPQGSRGGIGDAGRPGSARAPEGKQALDPSTDKPMIIRDPANAGRIEPIPMPGGGLLPTTRGNVSRAPQNQAALTGTWDHDKDPSTPEVPSGLGIGSLDTFPVNPEAMTPQWRQQMQGIGLMAFGIDRSQFAEGPEGDDLFIAATQKLLARHQQKVAAGFVAVPEVTGGYSYRPGKDMQDARQQREFDKDTDAFLAARPAINDSEGASALRAAKTPAERRRIKADLVRQDKGERRQALNDARSNEADQKNRNNPARAPGMFRDSLAQAGDNPAAIAAVYRDWGMPREARAIEELENDRRAVEQAGAVARAKAEGDVEKPDFEIANMGRRRVVEQMTDPDGPTMTHDAGVSTIAQIEGIDPSTPAGRLQAETKLARLLLQSGASTMHPSVQVAVRNIWRPLANISSWVRGDTEDGWMASKRTMFITSLRDELGITDAALAERLFNQYSQAPA